MQKLYYSIREISEKFDEEPHILRYWEKEFPVLHPKKNRAGNRIYSKNDLSTIEIIHHLIRIENMQVKDAIEFLKNNKNITIKELKKKTESSSENTKKGLSFVELTEIRDLLKETIQQLRT